MLGDALAHDGHGLHFVVAEVHALARHGGLERDVMLAARGAAGGGACGALRAAVAAALARTSKPAAAVNVGLGGLGLLYRFGTERRRRDALRCPAC